MSHILRKMIKLPLVLAFAALLTTASVYLMQLLISAEEKVPETTEFAPIGDITLPEIEFNPVRTSPKPELIEPVEMELELPPEIDFGRTEIPGDLTFFRYEAVLPEETQLSGIQYSEAVALRQVTPVYPNRALERGIEGFVLLEFDIDEVGRVIDPRVLDAEPEGVFERAALRAIERWRFQAKVEKGEPVIQRNEKRLLSFTLDE